jgi:mannosyltransferase OCH1-like enzyme
VIPKIIHQVWIGPSPCPVLCVDSWKGRNPDWKHHFWTEANLPFPLINQSQYEAIPRWNGKVDVIRYELLSRYGGPYMDCDSLCLRPLGDDFSDVDFLAVYMNERARPGRLSNGILGCTPGHSMIKEVVDAVGRVPLEDCRSKPSWMVTGPVLLTRVVGRYRDGPGVRFLPSYTFLPTFSDGTRCSDDQYRKAYARHLWTSIHRCQEIGATAEGSRSREGTP